MQYYKNPPIYVGTGEAAKILKLSVATVQTMADKGCFTTYITAGKHRRIKYDSS